MNIDIPTAMKPTCRDIRAPYTIRLKMSLPNSSVPKMYFEEGDSNACMRFCFEYVKGAMTFAKSAMTNRTMMRTSPITAIGLLFIRCQTSIMPLRRFCIVWTLLFIEFHP